MDEIDARLGCHFIGLQGSRLLKALQNFSSAAEMLAVEIDQLTLYFEQKELASISEWRRRHSWSSSKIFIAQRLFLKENQTTIVSWNDDSYPPLLREIPDPPPLLYVTGDVKKLAKPQIAIVGSRKMTAVGGKLSEYFAKDLACAGLTITSGLALGIDSHAHKGALEAVSQGSQASTIAVLGTGVDIRYPQRNEYLYSKILERGGALVSEYPLGTPARPGNFPKRNRIVTGLSMGVLVVEATERSGSLISARLAAEQGREVFAIPGSLYSSASRGCHHLIREGATLVTEPAQIVEQLGPMLDCVCGSVTSVSSTIAHDHQEKEEKHWLLNALGGNCFSVDQLVDLTARPVQEVLTAITELELSGKIASGGSGYQRVS